MALLIFFFMITNPIVIFNFETNSNLERWRTVNDDVMGGISASKFFLNKEGHGQFEGTVSTENNGGFCSVQYYFKQMSIQGSKSFAIRLKGDGKKYQFRVKSEIRKGYSYVYEFQTNGDWQTIQIPFKEMYASFRGRTLDLPNYDGTQLEEVAFLIGNKKDESFKLEIDSVAIK